MLYTLLSPLHSETSSIPFQVAESFIADHQVVAVLSGGTESQFVELVQSGQIDLHQPVFLLVSGYSNSLAASLEILSYIHQNGGKGEVLTDGQVKALSEEWVTIKPSAEILKGEKKLRLGVVGKPSDWLIASGVHYAEVLKRMNIELIDIDINEVSSLGEVDSGMKGAEAIYARLKELVGKYDLQGITLRCFDLLSTVKNTGCIALSKLNDEGIPAACESDIPTLLTMMVCKRVTGELCFQVNPARIQQDGEMLFAHCTLPLGMTESYSYTTHFESGIGVAIHGELPTGDYTLVKLSGDLKRLLAVDVELERCQYERNMCRTQVWIKAAPEVAQYFLKDPIANHHVLIHGHHAAKFRK